MGRALAIVVGLASAWWAMPAWPAGKVAVVLVDGHLRVRGDAEANLISLVSEAPAEITVGSFDGEGTINGGSEPFIAQGVQDVTFVAGAGDDVVNLVDLFPGTVPGDMTLATGSGNDSIGFDDTSVGGELTVATGAGDDAVHWDAGEYGAWTIHTGAGADTVAAEAFAVLGDVEVHTGSGPDAITTFVQTFRGDVEMAAGAGDDTVVLQDSVFDGDVTLDGGGGTDDFEDAGGNTFGGALRVERFEG